MDDAEWTALFEANYPMLVARLTMVLRDRSEAEDVAQEAYLRAYKARAKFDGRNATGWLTTIGVRLALNELRRRRRALARHIKGANLNEIPVPDHDLWEALNDLSPKQRAALLLHSLDGYTLEETAAILQVPPGTAASWVSRARAQMRTALAEE